MRPRHSLERLMTVPITQVDAFTQTPFSGNPAAVCVLRGEPLAAELMQRIAAEMNLSETAFLHPEADGYRLRWFTPKVEVDLCGHATLASAHVLFEEGHVSAGQPARFHTRSGLLTARRAGALIELDFPAKPEEPAQPPAGLAEALGLEPVYVGRSQFDYLVEVADEATLRAMSADFRRLRQVEARGVIVTCRSASAEFDFVSRFFAPQSGIDEDPVTGSAHCCLAPFWGRRLSRREMTGFQASSRGGVVHVRLAGERVILGGHAVTVLRGELLL
jgi:PhzF family phenazine biosynthesis protein